MAVTRLESSLLRRPYAGQPWYGMAKPDRFAIRLALLGVALTLCAHAQDPSAHAFQEGVASWYGPDFDGLRSASGEVFDSGQLTAAHRTLPFGTKVRVVRTDTTESIVVRINDRGPFVGSRIIDLSAAAARQLGMTDPGLFQVALEILEGPPIAPPSFFAVQVGTFRNPDNARRARDRMQEKFGESSVQKCGEFWRVLVGNAASQSDAAALAVAVRGSDRAFRSAYVVSVAQ
jgi:rare lipoprotein A (peptidoglycan hydrolase)